MSYSLIKSTGTFEREIDKADNSIISKLKFEIMRLGVCAYEAENSINELKFIIRDIKKSINEYNSNR